MATAWLDSRYMKLPIAYRAADNLLLPSQIPQPPPTTNKGTGQPGVLSGHRSAGNPPSGWDATSEGKASAALFKGILGFDWWDMAGDYVVSFAHPDGSVTWFPSVAQDNLGVTEGEPLALETRYAAVFFTYGPGETPVLNPTQQLAWQASVNVSNPTPTNPQTLVVTPRSATPAPAVAISASLFAAGPAGAAPAAYQAVPYVQAGPPPLIGDLLTAAEAAEYQRQRAPMAQQAPPTYEVVRAPAPLVPTWTKAVAGGLALLALGGGVYLIAKE